MAFSLLAEYERWEAAYGPSVGGSTNTAAPGGTAESGPSGNSSNEGGGSGSQETVSGPWDFQPYVFDPSNVGTSEEFFCGPDWLGYNYLNWLKEYTLLPDGTLFDNDADRAWEDYLEEGPDPDADCGQFSVSAGAIQGLFVIRGGSGSAWFVTFAIGTSSNDKLTGSGVLEGHAGNDTLTGGNGADHLFGGDHNDLLVGGAGNDILDGGTSADAMHGGTGDDIYYVTAYDQVFENASEGNDTVIAAVDIAYLSFNVEKLILSGSVVTGTGNSLDNLIYGNGANNTLDGGWGHDKLFGGDGNDRLLGAAGNDTLDGGGWADEMRGGAGNDTYCVDNIYDWVVEEVGEGTDTVISSADRSLQYTAIENLTLTGSARKGTGNGGNNVLIGNNLSNTLTSGGGSDTMEGGAGDDSFVFTASNGGLVEDFTAGFWNAEDDIGLSRSLFADFRAVQTAATQTGRDTVIAKDGFQLILKGVDKAWLCEADFFFI